MPHKLVEKKRFSTYADLLNQYQNNEIPYDILLQTEEWQKKRQEILKRDHYQCKKCNNSAAYSEFIIPRLQVHHRFYIVEKTCPQSNKFIYNLPWEYPNNALITVCNKCHHNIHKTTKIPFVEEISPGKYVEKKFTPCCRCSGRGYFGCYKHIEKGICFRCRGQRFEELI
jgi:5-methylcytosine-specific restriction endonuclease McrA